MKTFSKHITPTDAVSIAFLVFLSLINIFFFPSIPNALLFLTLNIVVIAVLIFLSKKEDENNFLQLLHDWYPLLLVPLVFKETYGMIHPLWQYDFDDVLIAIDRWLFGVNPTQWLQKISSPLLTEILQLAYTSYYLLFILLTVELSRRVNNNDFHYAVFCIVLGFFLSYAGYFLVPAVGPRFTLHDFSKIGAELPGLYFTNMCRSLINAGESIPANITNPIAFVQRDVFPSGHTELTLIVMVLAQKFKIKTRWFIFTIGTLLIFSTVYLRYHYVVDVLAGIGFMIVTFWAGEKIYKHITIWNT